MTNTPSLRPGTVVAVLFFAAALRAATFFLGHASGDQLFYSAIAMKLEARGFSGYTLRDVWERENPSIPGLEFVDRGAPGKSVVDAQKIQDLSFYDTPVFYVPPLFPTVLRLTHAALESGKPYALADKRFVKGKRFALSREATRRELYATLPSFAASLLTVFLTLLFGARFLGPRAGVTAALLLAVSPVELLAATRVWPDALLALFSTLALFLFYSAASAEKPFRALLAGACLGLALLTKGQALFLVPAAVIWRFVTGDRPLARRILDPVLWAFLGAAFWVSLPWFWAVTNAAGTPFWTPPFPLPAVDGNARDWYLFVTKRPWYVYPLDTLFQNPAFTFAFFPFAFYYLNLERPLHAKLWGLLFGWCVLLPVLFLALWPGREERYLLPAYPALALLAAASLEHARGRMEREWHGRPVGDWFVTLLIVGSCAWSLPLAWFYLVVAQLDAIPVPF